MESSLHSNRNIPNYILLSLAIVQSEIYWLCSVIYCLCQVSGLLNKPPSTTSTTIYRSRPQLAPPKIQSPTTPSNDKENVSQERRFSLPNDTVHIRERPTEKDEQVGTTCPPLWWQRTRVRLGHAPVHGDPKPKKTTLSNNNTSPSAVTFASTKSSIKRADSISPPISEHNTFTESPLSSPSLTPTDKRLGDSSPLCLSNSSTTISSSSTDGSSISTSGGSLEQKKSKRKKLLTKINAALHHRRKNDTTEPRN